MAADVMPGSNSFDGNCSKLLELSGKDRAGNPFPTKLPQRCPGYPVAPKGSL